MQGIDPSSCAETTNRSPVPKHWISKPGEEWGDEELDILNVTEDLVKNVDGLALPSEPHYKPPPQFSELLAQLDCKLDLQDKLYVRSYLDRLAKSTPVGFQVASFYKTVLKMTGEADKLSSDSIATVLGQHIHRDAPTFVRKMMHIPAAGAQLLLRSLFGLIHMLYSFAVNILSAIAGTLCSVLHVGDAGASAFWPISSLNPRSPPENPEPALSPKDVLPIALLNLLQEIYHLHLAHANQEAKLQVVPDRDRERLFHLWAKQGPRGLMMGNTEGCSTQGGPSFCAPRLQHTILRVQESSRMSVNREDSDKWRKAFALDFAQIFGAAMSKSSRGALRRQMLNQVYRTGLLVSIDKDVAYIHKFTYSRRYLAFFASNYDLYDDAQAKLQTIECGWHLLQPASLGELLYQLSRWIWQAHNLTGEDESVFY